jgi:hypothetical protein
LALGSFSFGQPRRKLGKKIELKLFKNEKFTWEFSRQTKRKTTAARTALKMAC